MHVRNVNERESRMPMTMLKSATNENEKKKNVARKYLRFLIFQFLKPFYECFKQILDFLNLLAMPLSRFRIVCGLRFSLKFYKFAINWTFRTAATSWKDKPVWVSIKLVELLCEKPGRTQSTASRTFGLHKSFMSWLMCRRFQSICPCSSYKSSV